MTHQELLDRINGWREQVAQHNANKAQVEQQRTAELEAAAQSFEAELKTALDAAAGNG